MNRNFSTNPLPSNAAKLRQVHWIVLISVAATLAGSMAAPTISKFPAAHRLLQKLGVSETKASLDKVVEELVDEFRQASAFEQKDVLDGFVSMRSPNDIGAISTTLFKSKDATLAGLLAVQLAETGAKRYRSNKLRFLVISECLKGTSVAKDFGKARAILDLPEMQIEKMTDYYKGVWWLDKDNPENDLVRAEYYLQRAKNNGIPLASKLLANLRSQSN